MPEQLQLMEFAEAEQPQAKTAARPGGLVLDPRQVRRADLSESLIEVADVIGVQNVVKLVQAHGGTDFYVPRALRLGGALAAIVGKGAARSLVVSHGGSMVYLSTFNALRRRLRDRAMRAAYDSGGGTVSDIAREHGLSRRRVSTILNRTE